MRTLACLLKQPSETFQTYNARLLEACRVLRPTAARLVVVADQPKVDLLLADEESSALRVAVCPLAADDAPDDHDDEAVDHGGRVPFGMRKRGGRYQEHPHEAPVVRTILRAAATGQTADLIERTLMAEHGQWVRAQWAPKEVPRHIRRILTKIQFYRDHLPGVA
jgi:hypothetical protein